MNSFTQHKGYTRTYKEKKLTLGMVFPLESYPRSVPIMDIDKQIKLAKLAEKSNFASLFVRDVPLNDPTFGDAGQMYDPWVFLSYLAAHTKDIALGTSSVITSFQNPVNLAKSTASFDKISKERLLLGLATGDRPVEFNVFGVDREQRAAYYRETFHVLRKAWAEDYPVIQTERVTMKGETDILPKPTLKNIPTFVTGFSSQSLEWIAENGDGWIGYPRSIPEQAQIIRDFRAHTDEFKPFTQSLYIDLLEDPNAEPSQIHLGFRCGYPFLVEFLQALEAVGVNHVILVLKFASRPIEDVIQDLAEHVIPHFPALTIE